MSKRTFIWFGIAVLVLAVVIPFAIFRSKGDASSGGSSQEKSAKELFVINCGTCHTLSAAGTDGNYAPNLDELLAPTGPPEGKDGNPDEVKKYEETVEATAGRVLNAVENGVNSSTPGRMPGGILNESQAKEVAAWVGENAGEG
ncbi:MAG TPA: c-type cytochrome [Solirubrobacterales bacterium]|nr:c-type cytochrome [Solirubrobacterales bacterium]